MSPDLSSITEGLKLTISVSTRIFIVFEISGSASLGTEQSSACRILGAGAGAGETQGGRPPPPVSQERGPHPALVRSGAPGYRPSQQGAPVPVQVVQPQSISVLSPNCEHCQHAGGGLTPPAPSLGL